MNIPSFAPGCFGSVIAFSETDVVCVNCTFAESCQKAHMRVKNELQMRFGITVPKRRRKITVDPETGDTTLMLPSKTQKLLNSLDVSADDVCGSLQRNINPFREKGPKYLSLLCHLLVRMHQPIKSDDLVMAFVTKFGWKKDTAKVHARTAVQALEHVGAIRRIDGLICLKENNNVQTEINSKVA